MHYACIGRQVQERSAWDEIVRDLGQLNRFEARLPAHLIEQIRRTTVVSLPIS
jgi:hypothetical protein